MKYTEVPFYNFVFDSNNNFCMKADESHSICHTLNGVVSMDINQNFRLIPKGTELYVAAVNGVAVLLTKDKFDLVPIYTSRKSCYVVDEYFNYTFIEDLYPKNKHIYDGEQLCGKSYLQCYREIGYHDHGTVSFHKGGAYEGHGFQVNLKHGDCYVAIGEKNGNATMLILKDRIMPPQDHNTPTLQPAS